jgi:leucyl/phenylalanyl-tRNA---protein transferase
MSNEYYKLSNGYVLSIQRNTPFPDLNHALKEPNGLLAIGGDLSTERLLNAYQKGIFPWFNEGEPILWWSPNPRMVLFPSELKISRSLKKNINKNLFEIRFNTAFRQVVESCSHTPRASQSGTWINHDIIDAYCRLNTLGHALSMESWQNNQLVGGCYGVIIGRMFYGESMFHLVPDASKIAFVNLVHYLEQLNVGMIDCQMNTPLLASFGAREITRDVFIKNLTQLIEHDTA